MVYKIGNKIKFVDGVYKGKTGTIQALPSEGSSKYTIMLDDGKIVKFNNEFFEILNDEGNKHENYQDDEMKTLIGKEILILDEKYRVKDIGVIHEAKRFYGDSIEITIMDFLGNEEKITISESKLENRINRVNEYKELQKIKHEFIGKKIGTYNADGSLKEEREIRDVKIDLAFKEGYYIFVLDDGHTITKTIDGIKHEIEALNEYKLQKLKCKYAYDDGDLHCNEIGKGCENCHVNMENEMESNGDDEITDEKTYVNEKVKEGMPDIIKAKTNKKEMENFFKLIEYLRDDGVIIKIDSIKHEDGEMEMELPVINSIFVDPGHVAMMDISLLPDEIDENAKGIEFAIDPNTIKRFLKHYESKDEMIFHRIENNKLFLKHEGIEFAIGLLDPDEMSKEKPPKLEFKGSAILPVKKLRKTLRSINEINDIAQIEIKHDKVIVYGENDAGHIKAIFKKDECDEINIIDDSDEIRSMYNIGDYLKGFIDLLYSLKIDKVKIEMAKDYPIKIHFKTGNIQGYFLLAPRIEM